MKRTWEYLIYKNDIEFDTRCNTVAEGGYTNRATCINDCKTTLRKLGFFAPIVKIQSNDRERIDIFTVTHKHGNIVFSDVTTVSHSM